MHKIQEKSIHAHELKLMFPRRHACVTLQPLRPRGETNLPMGGAPTVKAEPVIRRALAFASGVGGLALEDATATESWKC